MLTLSVTGSGSVGAPLLPRTPAARLQGMRTRPIATRIRSKTRAMSRLMTIPTTTSSRMPRCLPFWKR
ncbi:hypothetical protein AKG07_09465 [Microbacterium sp. CGR1]|nr:hypothetical protein AKG07_09465 [Microbacterium sp. CGR1]